MRPRAVRTYQAFTLIEVLVVIFIIALLLGILLPALGAARRATRQMINGTQVRGIHQGMILYAQTNNDWFPGIVAETDSRTHLNATDHPGRFPNQPATQTGAHPAVRFRELIDERLIDSRYLLSPAEVKDPLIEDADALTTANYSYALLQIAIVADHRTTDWRGTNNGQAVVIADRAVSSDANGGASGGGGGSQTLIKSVHTDPGASEKEWKGSVGFNDNHVNFETDELVDTVYGSQRHKTLTPDDNLFQADPSTGYALSGGDAILVWSDAEDAIDEAGLAF